MPGIQSGPAAYITLSNVSPVPGTNAFTVSFDTDQPVLMAMDFWSQNDSSLAGLAGSVLEGVLRTHHVIASGALPAGDHTGKVMGFSLRLDANDVSGKTLRSVQGFVQLIGSRTTQKGNALPVRFNNYGDGTRPANGGATQQGPYLVGGGNWSSYTWAQWNPKGTTYPAP